MRWKFNIKSKVDTNRLFFVRKLSIVRLFFYIGLTIAILGAMQPWFMWPFAAYYTLIAATFVFFSFLIDNGQQTHLFRREGFVIPIVLFFLSTFVMRLVNKNNIIGFISISFDLIIYYSLLRLDKEEMRHMMDCLTKLLAAFLVISILGWVLYLVGFPSPYIDSANDDLGYSYENHFIFMIDDRWDAMIIPRFNSIFLEPGHLGTLTSLFLMNQLGKWKKWYNIVLLITTLLTFSLAAYVLLPIIALMGAWAKGKRIIIAIISIIVVIVSIGIGALYYNDGDNLVNNLIMARLEISDDGKLEGDNRVTDSFDAEYQSFLSSSDLLTGREYSMEKFGFGNSGYRVFLYDNGLIALLLVALFYLSLAVSSRQQNKRVILTMLTVTLLTFIIRSAPLAYNYFIPLYAFLCTGFSSHEVDKQLSPKEES